MELIETEVDDALAESLRNVIKMLLVWDALGENDPQVPTAATSSALEDMMLGASLVANSVEEIDHSERVREAINFIVGEVRQYMAIVEYLGERPTD